MKTASLAACCAPLLLLLACTPSSPAREAGPEPAEEWKREALLLRKEYAQRSSTNEWDSWPAKVADILDHAEPPAVVGPDLEVRPPTDVAVDWPAPKDEVLTVRYRINQKGCSFGDMGCHLVTVCPVDVPAGTAAAAREYSHTRVAEHAGPKLFEGTYAEVIEVPSPRCELRLYAQDHHGSRVCSARGPKLPASWSGGSAVHDAGTIMIDPVRCEGDPLLDRMLFRGTLIYAWQKRNGQNPR